MSFLGIGLSTVIAIFFAIHAIRTNQSYYWLFILFVFPFLGSIVYAFAIFVPSMRSLNSIYHLESSFRQAINPYRELKQAQSAYELSPTTEANLRLAKALVDNNRASESLVYYENALSGIYKNAPDILLQYAYALYLTKDYSKAQQTLDILKSKNPNVRSNEEHLLYAKILLAQNNKEAAHNEFSTLIDNYPTLEALSQYIDALIHWQLFDEAKIQLQNYQIRLKHMPKHAKRLNKQWIKQIEASKAKLK